MIYESGSLTLNINKLLIELVISAVMCVVFILELPDFSLCHWLVALIQFSWFSASRRKYRVVLRLV